MGRTQLKDDKQIRRLEACEGFVGLELQLWNSQRRRPHAWQKCDQVSVAVSTLRARLRNGDGSPNNNLIAPQLRILNDSAANVPLSQITIRYFYTDETLPSAQVFQPFFAQNQSNWANIPFSNITSQFVQIAPPANRRYLQIGFTASAGTLVAGSAVALYFQIHAQNWANYQETNDHSYTPSAVEIDWNKVTVYRNGTLVWGVEP